MNSLFRKTTVQVSLCIATLAISAGTLRSQILLKGTGTVYESSQNTQARAASNLFDGTPVVGSAAGNGPGLFDGSNNTANNPPGGTDNDYAPIVAFDLGAVYTVSGAGYANNTFNANSFTGSITIFTLTAAQYGTYISTLLPAENTARQGGLANPPSSFQSTESLTITDTADANYNLYNLDTPLTGEYYALQFNNSLAGYTGTTAFLGGQEFEFVESPVGVPEPASLSLLGVGLGVLAFCARRRLALSSR